MRQPIHLSNSVASRERGHLLSQTDAETRWEAVQGGCPWPREGAFDDLEVSLSFSAGKALRNLTAAAAGEYSKQKKNSAVMADQYSYVRRREPNTGWRARGSCPGRYSHIGTAGIRKD